MAYFCSTFILLTYLYYKQYDIFVQGKQKAHQHNHKHDHHYYIDNYFLPKILKILMAFANNQKYKQRLKV